MQSEVAPRIDKLSAFNITPNTVSQSLEEADSQIPSRTTMMIIAVVIVTLIAAVWFFFKKDKAPEPEQLPKPKSGQKQDQRDVKQDQRDVKIAQQEKEMEAMRQQMAAQIQVLQAPPSVAQPPAVAAQPPAVVAQSPAVAAHPPAVAAHPPAVVAQSPDVVQPPSVAQPAVVTDDQLSFPLPPQLDIDWDLNKGVVLPAAVRLSSNNPNDVISAYPIAVA